MTSFFRLESAIEICTQHPTAVPLADPEINAVLAGHVAGVAYAVFERRVRELVAERCRHPEDEPINRFVSAASKRLVRSIKISELAGTLGLFGETEKRAFQDRLSKEPEISAAWDNLITGRHGVAHDIDSAPTMTLLDIQRDLEGAERVLAVFEAALIHADCASV